MSENLKPRRQNLILVQKKQNNLKRELLKFFKGVWSNGPWSCQLLGLCPLLAVTTSAASATGLPLPPYWVLCVLCTSLIRKLIFKEVRIPIYVLLIATLVTVRFYTQAYFQDLYHS